MGGVELEAVEAGPSSPEAGGDEIVDQRPDLVGRELARRDLGGRVVDGGGGDGHTSAELFLGLAPGMGDLEDDPRREAVDGFRDAGQPADEPVVVNGHLARAGLARRLDVGMAGDDQPDLALGKTRIELHMRVRDMALVVGHEIVGRRADEAVGDQERSDAEGREEDIHGPIVDHTGAGKKPGP